MAENHNQPDRTNEAAKRNVVEKMWLHHYNAELFKQGLITEPQFRRMKISINSRKPTALER